MTVEDLLNLTTSEFTTYVRDNVGNDDPQLWDALLGPQVVNATRDVLLSIHMDLESQLGQRRAELETFQHQCFAQGPEGRTAYFEAKAEHDGWRARALGFKRIVHRRLEKARSIASQAATRAAPHRTTRPGAAPPPPNPTKIQHNIRTLFELTYAIWQHRQSCKEGGIVPEPHDLALWDRLETCAVYSTEHGTQPLSAWLERAMAKPDWTPPPERE